MPCLQSGVSARRFPMAGVAWGIMRPLNPKQLKFVERYLATGNATQSYIDAGYTKNPENARRAASLLLTNIDVKKAIEAARSKALERFPLTYESALENMWEQARYHGDDASHMARVKATELVMQHFRPPSPLSGNVNVNVAVISDDELRRRIEALEGGAASSGTGGTEGGTGTPGGETRLLEVASPLPAENVVGLEASQAVPAGA